MSRLTPLLPRALAPGATIGLVSPGRWSPPDDLARGVAALEGMGYRVKVHPQNHLRHHQFAGTDDDRAAALEDIFAEGALMEDQKRDRINLARQAMLNIVDQRVRWLEEKQLRWQTASRESLHV